MLLHLLMALAPVTSIVPQTSTPGPRHAQDDPSKLICVSRDVTGSRLETVRECHTALQWQDQKLQNKVDMLRKQYNGDRGDLTLRDILKAH